MKNTGKPQTHKCKRTYLKAGKWICDNNIPWSWRYKCGTTGFIANIRAKWIDRYFLNDILLKPTGIGILDPISHTTIGIYDTNEILIANWCISDGQLIIRTSRLTNDCETQDIYIRNGYGLRQAICMTYLKLIKCEIIDKNGKVKSK